MKTIQWLLAAAAIAVAFPVLATPTTNAYDFGSAPTSGTTYTTFGDAASYNGLYNSTYFGNSAVYAGTSSIPGGTAQSTTVTAWASTGTAAAPTAAASGSTGSGVNSAYTTMAAGTIQNAVLTAYQVANGGTGQYSGNGYALAETSRNTNGGYSPGNHDFTCGSSNGVNTCTPDVPQHAVDNSGAYETLLYSFSSAVTLSSVTLGYPSVGSQNDGTSDLTILYCKAANVANCATSTFSGQTYSQLVSSGNWGYTNLLNLSSSNDTGSTGLNVKSNYWMIGAFIADLPNQVAGDGVADYVKIRAIQTCTTTICAVPEPDSVALFGIAGGALWLGRRRRQSRIA